MFKKLSLRIRVTIMTTLIATATCGIMTFSSINSVGNTFSPDNIFETIKAVKLQPSASTTNTPALMLTPAETLEILPYAKIEPVRIELIKITKQYNYNQLILMCCITLFTAIATYYLMGKALSPVTELAQAVDNLDENNLTSAISENLGYGELSHLATAFNKMADRLETAFTYQKQFATSAAHELKTPLASIKTNIDVFKMDETHTEDEYNELIGITERQTDRLIGLVEGLLIISNKSMDNQDSFTLSSHLITIKNELTQQYAHYNPTININADDIILTGNITLLERLFYNIIENGIKYTGNNAIINIDNTITENTLTISISDNGVGIPLEDRVKIFEPFFRVDKSRSRSIGGSGLGLSICKMIAQQHNATILCNENPQGGTAFTVIFPI